MKGTDKSITSRFIENHIKDSIGFLELSFPKNHMEIKFLLERNEILTIIPELRLSIYELEQLLLNLKQNLDYDKLADTQFFHRIRFTKRDPFFGGSLTLWYSYTNNMIVSVKIENTIWLQYELESLIDTFKMALQHCEFKSGLAFE